MIEIVVRFLSFRVDTRQPHLRIHLLVTEQEQTCLNERLLNSDQLSTAIQRVEATIEKLMLVLDFSSEMLSKDSTSSPDVLMLQLSTHRKQSGTLFSLSPRNSQ